MSDHITEQKQNPISNPGRTFHYPWAAAPDIIRSNQKDAYFQSILLQQLSTVIRSLYGARTEHKWVNEASVFTELLYLSLTTLIGNRTLGEEYTDIVQVEDITPHRLPSLTRRTSYIVFSVLLPYALGRFLPAFRRKFRSKLEATIRHSKNDRISGSTPSSKTLQVQEYLLKHLDSITSPAPTYAIGLAVFYFTGAYYQLAKRVTGLRYVFTRRVDPNEARAGYEVLGVLLVAQMAVQVWLHLSETYDAHIRVAPGPSPTQALDGGSAVIDGGIEIGTDNHFSTPLLFEPMPEYDDSDEVRSRVAKETHTPLAKEGEHRYDLKHERVLPWIEGRQLRKCTLCLEPMKDPSVTTCGHVFCWSCVTDWLREQPMCPLCRQAALAQHVLPLRG